MKKILFFLTVFVLGIHTAGYSACNSEFVETTNTLSVYCLQFGDHYYTATFERETGTSNKLRYKLKTVKEYDLIMPFFSIDTAECGTLFKNLDFTFPCFTENGFMFSDIRMKFDDANSSDENGYWWSIEEISYDLAGLDPPTVSSFSIPSLVDVDERFAISFIYDDPDNDVEKIIVNMSDGTHAVFDVQAGSGSFYFDQFWFASSGCAWVEVYAVDSENNQSEHFVQGIEVGCGCSGEGCYNPQ